MEKRKNRPGRLPRYDYSSVGYYFITFCTRRRECCLSSVGTTTCVGRDDPGAPKPPADMVTLTSYGTTLNDMILSIPDAYPYVTVQKYVIMPNHVHLLLSIDENGIEVGAPGSSRPTPGSSRPTQLVPRIIAYLKRVTSRTAGRTLWQSTYYDHIIRDEADYLRIWQYIDTNPAKWRDDCYYIP